MKGFSVPMGFRRLLLFALPVLAGIALLAGLRRSRPDAPRAMPEEKRVSARVVTVVEAAVVPQAIGYGTAMPARVWEAVAEVSGKVMVIHPRLKRGALLPASASRERMRAVLLTSLTTIAGLLPLLTESSLQAQVLIPLATSIVFGLAASTLLVLLVLPAAIAILGDFGLMRTEADVAEE